MAKKKAAKKRVFYDRDAPRDPLMSTPEVKSFIGMVWAFRSMKEYDPEFEADLRDKLTHHWNAVMSTEQRNIMRYVH